MKYYMQLQSVKSLNRCKSVILTIFGYDIIKAHNGELKVLKENKPSLLFIYHKIKLFIMNKLSFVAVLIMALGFVSCETDIDVNAEPTDITIVYGLLNPNDTTHYLKINKAFIGEGSAFVILLPNV